MAKKVIVVRIGTNEVQIVHMEHTANYPTVYGCSYAGKCSKRRYDYRGC